jgi:hypothetical protein
VPPVLCLHTKTPQLLHPPSPLQSFLQPALNLINVSGKTDIALHLLDLPGPLLHEIESNVQIGLPAHRLPTIVQRNVLVNHVQFALLSGCSGIETSYSPLPLKTHIASQYLQLLTQIGNYPR